MENSAEDKPYLLENKSNSSDRRAQTTEKQPVFHSNSYQDNSNSAQKEAEMLENLPNLFQHSSKKVENSPVLAQNTGVFRKNSQQDLQLEIQQSKPAEKLEVLENPQQPVKGEELQTLEIFGSYLEQPPVGALELQKQANFQLDEEQLEIAKNLKFQSYEAILKGIIKTQNTISAYKGRGADYSHYTKELNRLKALKDAYIANQLNQKNKGGKNA